MADVSQLEARRVALLDRCAIERARLHDVAEPLLDTGRRLDAGLQTARRFISQPAVIVLGVMVLTFVGRSRSIRFAGRTLSLASMAWRVVSLTANLTRQLRARQVPPAVMSATRRRPSLEKADVR